MLWIKHILLHVPLVLALSLAAPLLANEPVGASTASHTGHTEMDERLVPIPPSHDTIATAVWVLVIFVVMLAILYKTAWKNVLAGLKAREQRIRKDIADAEAARAKAEATLREYNAQLATAEGKVREMISAAAIEGERISTQIKMQAQQECETAKERATKDIETAKKQAIQEIYAEAANLSTNIAEKILRRNLNADDQRDLISRSLEQLQGVGKN